MRSSHAVHIALIRHSETYKNLEERHGGGDQRLTPTGEAQAKALGRALLAVSGNTALLHQPELRTKESARLIGAAACCPTKEDTRLRGIGIGKLAGLSDQEIAQNYPEAAARIRSWKKHQTPLELPADLGAEPLDAFAERVHEGLKTNIGAVEEHGCIAIVGTTSTLTMARHLIENDAFDPESYAYYHQPLGGLESWMISSQDPLYTGTLLS